jgi:hypothetical protein
VPLRIPVEQLQAAIARLRQRTLLWAALWLMLDGEGVIVLAELARHAEVGLVVRPTS